MKISNVSSAWQTFRQSATKLECYAGREFQTTALKTAKSLAPSTVLVLRTTSFRASADLRCRLLATDETGMKRCYCMIIVIIMFVY